MLCFRCLLVFVVMSLPCRVIARVAVYHFNPALLGENISSDSLSALSKGKQLPGAYIVSVYVNSREVNTARLTFIQSPDTEQLYPCLSRENLSQYGIKVPEREVKSIRQHPTCVDIASVTHGAVVFTFSRQRLQLNVPQIALEDTGDDDLAPVRLWDEGIPAALLNFRASADETEYTRKGETTRSSSQYLSLTPGMNIAGWHIRSALDWENTNRRWERQFIYADRGLNQMKSRLSIGETSTPSDVFDGVPFNGVMLGSDDNMVPWRLRTLSPDIRGVATTNAVVRVSRDGYLIYQTTVPAGPFELTDFTPPSGGGDLQVTVQEQDGSYRGFTVPYQPAAIALREGYVRYHLMAGHFRSANARSYRAQVGQLTLAAGLPLRLTLFGGLQYAGPYRALNAGSGYSLGEAGAVSVDVTSTRTEARRGTLRRGDKFRVRYIKAFSQTGTLLQLSHQIVSEGYRSLNDAMDGFYSDSDGGDNSILSSVSLSQPLGRAGNLNVSAACERYGHGTVNRYDAGYSIGAGRWALSLNAGVGKRYTAHSETTERTASLNINYFPGNTGGSGNISYRLLSQQEGVEQQVGLSGSNAGQRLNWNISHNRLLENRADADTGAREKNSVSASAMWSGARVRSSGYFRFGSVVRQYGGSVSGGLVAHAHGVTMGQPFGQTVALIEAPGVGGVAITGQPGAATDDRGYAITSLSRLYRTNTVGLDPFSLPDDAEVDHTDMHVVPVEGAVIPVAFRTHPGSRAILTVQRAGGRTVPFGAIASLITKAADDAGEGIVDEAGRVWLTGLPATGQLLVRWGSGPDEACHARYSLSRAPKKNKTYMLNVLCH
ncbi:fimbrial biogenesis outer membrane usher protein [Klebsiella aerogenes]|nr:fimbrial biogenesis outer membrane usher protein [Klebsiella aerogenes]ELY3087841.1 fimbrial biogenesis outer membrane usher protein [Klebsiella aerogenes]